MITAASQRARVLLCTEGTYPFMMGGVSTWCDVLVNGLADVDWQVLPLTAGGLHREVLFTLPPNARLVAHIDLWSEAVHAFNPFTHRRADRTELPGHLLRGLLSWDSDLGALTEALLWCRANPSRVRVVFRSRAGWDSFLAALDDVLAERHHALGSTPDLDVLQATELYQCLYWVARSAAVATPSGADAPDLLLVTAAGWASIPAVVHKALHGTPMVLTEHGVYVREAYLAAIRGGLSASARWMSSRLARGLTRLAYHAADVIAPVTEANTAWEHELGASRAQIRTIYNGVLVPTHATPPPRRRRVVTIGRLDALKDVKTLLRTAKLVVGRVPDVRFVHFGPVPDGGDAYARECMALHRDLELGGSFLFMGPTEEPLEELEASDIALLTSISEGFPISVLEAMACARPVVATAVGGVREAVSGCGFTAPPGDPESLAEGVVTLLLRPELGETLGQRGRARAIRKFGQANCLLAYRDLLQELTGMPVASPVVPDEPDIGLRASPVSDLVGDHVRPNDVVAPEPEWSEDHDR